MCQRRSLPLTDEQRQQLLHYRDHHPKPFVRERAAALLQIAAGHSPHAVARAGILRPRHPDTVYAWLDTFLAEGLDGLRAHQQGGFRRQRLR
jgi:Homeodomain-like domain